jgi:hypothetical protein
MRYPVFKWFQCFAVALVISAIGTWALADNAKVSEWFAKYNEVRHRAQMTPEEKERSGRLLTQGMVASVFHAPDDSGDKQASAALLKKMVDRYSKAIHEMDQLPAPAETKKLHLGYRQYFTNARGVFSDYLKIQGNLFATDASGNSIVGQLQERKSALEALDASNKDLDAKLRAKYHIAPYPYDVPR